MVNNECRVIAERLEDLLAALPEAFWWGATPQGFEYWDQVEKNLKSLRPSQETCACRCVRDDGTTRFNINCHIHGKAP